MISSQENATFFIPDTAGVEIHDDIKPFAAERVISKHYPNSFRETGLLEELNKDHIERLVICGAMSHMCIDATVRAAVDLGFEAVLIEDACATRDLSYGNKTVPAEQVHYAFVSALNGMYANVTSTDAFLKKNN